MENVAYIRIDSVKELRSWFLIIFSGAIINLPEEKQENFAFKLNDPHFMCRALNHHCDCKFDFDGVNAALINTL